MPAHVHLTIEDPISIATSPGKARLIQGKIVATARSEDDLFDMFRDKDEIGRSPWTRDGSLALFQCIRAKAEARGAA